MAERKTNAEIFLAGTKPYIEVLDMSQRDGAMYEMGQRDRDAEIERLRAVLRKIVDVTERWDVAGEYARDALEGTDG